MSNNTLAMARSLLPRTRSLLVKRVTEATDADRPTTLALIRLIKERDLPWPVSRITRVRVDAVLFDCGFYQDECGQWHGNGNGNPEPTPSK